MPRPTSLRISRTNSLHPHASTGAVSIRSPLWLCLVLALSAAGSAFAAPPSSSLSALDNEVPPIWIASGPPGGTYRSVYAPHFEDLLRGQRVLYRDTAGSAQNVALMAEGKADIAFVQADVYAKAFAAGEAADMQVIGRLADECVYIAHRVESPIKTLEDLKSPADGQPARVAVGPPESGPAGTWLWMSDRIPALAGNEVDPEAGTLALNQLAVGAFDAVVWVTDPTNFEHKMLRAANSNDRLAIMPVTDAALLEPLADGTVVYTKRKVALQERWRGKKIETVCTSALVVMRRDADRKFVDRISDLISLKRELLVPRQN